MPVLRGAVETLARGRPILLVEAEGRQRAGAVSELSDFMLGRGLDGWFALNGGMESVATFDPATHPLAQAGEAGYVNDFELVPTEHSGEADWVVGAHGGGVLGGGS